jgi:hypothetical protein
MELSNQQKALQIREHSKRIEWLTASVLKEGPISLPLMEMHIEHLENTISFIKANFSSDSYVLKRQGVYTKKEWICMLEVELYYRLSRRFNKFSYPDALQTLEELFSVEFCNPLDYIEAEFEEVSVLSTTLADSSIKELTEEELRARHILSSYCRGTVAIKDHSSIYGLRSTIKSRLKSVKSNPSAIHRVPFTESEWLAIVELELAYRSKQPSANFRKVYRPEIAKIMKKLEASNKDRSNIVEIRPKTPKVVTKDPTEYCVYKLDLSKSGNLTPTYGSLKEDGITFSEDRPTLFEKEDVIALTKLLNKYNTDQTVEYKYGFKGYAVALKESYLVYKTGKDKAFYFCPSLEDATSFNTKKEAEEAREKVLLVFDSLTDKEVTLQVHISEVIAEDQMRPVLPQAQ